jgi:hypothetical protein
MDNFRNNKNKLSYVGLSNAVLLMQNSLLSL